MRAVGLDIHRSFCEVAIHEGGVSRSAGRVKTTPEALAVFASSLTGEDWVAMEVSGNAAEIVRIIEPHVARSAAITAVAFAGSNPMPTAVLAAWNGVLRSIRVDRSYACR